jgi:hypothetical protein
MPNTNGLFSSRDVSATGDPNSGFFVRADEPIATPSPLQIISSDATKVLTISEANNGTATIGNDGNIVIGTGVTVGGTVLSVNGPLGLGRVYDTLYNLPTSPEGTPGLPEVLSVNNSAGSTQINMNSNKIINCLNPTNPQDVATKNYVDTRPAPATPTLAQVLTAGNVANTDINVNGQKLLSVANPTLQGDGTNKLYVDTLDGANVKLTGDQTIAGVKTFSNQMNLGSNKIVSLGAPTDANDAVTKTYVDTRIDRTLIRSFNTTLTTTVDSTGWTVPANGTYEVEVIVNSTGATLVAGGIYNTRIRAVGGAGFINNSTNFITATAMTGEGGFVISKHYYNVFLTRNFNTSPQNYEIQTYATAGSVSGGTVQINIYRLN